MFCRGKVSFAVADMGHRRRESCSLTNMLSLLPAPKHYFTSLSTVEKGTCKRRISATFLGTRTIFIRAVPKIFCRVNRP